MSKQNIDRVGTMYLPSLSNLYNLLTGKTMSKQINMQWHSYGGFVPFRYPLQQKELGKEKNELEG